MGPTSQGPGTAVAARRRRPPHRGPEAPEYGMDTPISQRPVVRPVCKAGRTQVVWKPDLLLPGARCPVVGVTRLRARPGLRGEKGPPS